MTEWNSALNEHQWFPKTKMNDHLVILFFVNLHNIWHYWFFLLLWNLPFSNNCKLFWPCTYFSPAFLFLLNSALGYFLKFNHIYSLFINTFVLRSKNYCLLRIYCKTILLSPFVLWCCIEVLQSDNPLCIGIRIFSQRNTGSNVWLYKYIPIWNKSVVLQGKIN